LSAKRGAKVERSPALSWLSVVTVSAVLLFTGARLMVWMAALIAGLF